MKKTDRTLEIIKDYLIDGTYKYALLIDGEWGIGKTYFVDNVLNNELTNRKIIKISLFGLNSNNEIKKKIEEELLFSHFNIKNNSDKSRMLFTSINSIGREIIKGKYGVDTNIFDNISVLPYIDIDLSEYLIVFDDFERCRCNVVDTLGVINEYVEQKAMKVIVVCDSTKITDKNRNDFEMYKEKTIGITIKYVPDYENILRNIISKFDFGKYNEIVNNEKLYEELVDIANKYEYYNLRTVQYFISRLIRILNLIDIDVKEDTINNITKYVFIVSIIFKKNLKYKEWADNEFGSFHVDVDINDEFEFSNNYDAFKFVDDYIKYSYIDKERIIETIKSYENRYAIYSKDPLNEIDSWYMNDDKYLQRCIIGIFEKLKKREYCIESYPRIVKTFSYLYGYEVIEKDIVEKLENIMLENIEKETIIYSIDWRDFLLESDIKENYLEIVRKLENAYKNKCTKIKRKVIEDIFSKENWGDLLEEYNQKERNRLDNSIFKLIDVGILSSKIYISDVNNLSKFRRVVNSQYQYSNISEYYKADKENLKSLLDLMKKYDNSKFGRVKTFTINCIIGDLENIIERLQ